MNCDTIIEKQINNYREAIIPILLKNDVRKADIFGSFARNVANIDNDIDILVHFKERILKEEVKIL